MPVGENLNQHWCVPGEHWYPCPDFHLPPCMERTNVPCSIHQGFRSLKPSEREALMRQNPITDPERYVPHITEVPDLVDCLPDMATEYRDIQDQMTALEARKKELAGEIKVLLDALELRAVRGDGWMVTRVKDTETESLSQERLLALGVSMDTILEAIVKSPKAGYVQVSKPKVQG